MCVGCLVSWEFLLLWAPCSVSTHNLHSHDKPAPPTFSCNRSWASPGNKARQNHTPFSVSFFPCSPLLSSSSILLSPPPSSSSSSLVPPPSLLPPLPPSLQMREAYKTYKEGEWWEGWRRQEMLTEVSLMLQCNLFPGLSHCCVLWFTLTVHIWTYSEKFVPTVDQPHQGKSVHVNSHEVTTKNISDVHSAISRKLNDLVPSVYLGWPFAAFTKIAQCMQKRMQHPFLPGTRLQYVMCCRTYAPE